MPTLWNQALKSVLLSCRTDAELLEHFPEHNLQTLKRRQREFRGERDLQYDPDELFRVQQKRERVEITGLRDGTRILITSDYQIPFCDWASVAAVEEFIKDWKPDLMVYNGDILDCYAISSFAKNPTRRVSLNDELRMGRELLDRHRKLAPEAKMFWIDGNHEDRLSRELWNHAPEIFGIENDDGQVLTMSHLLGLPKRNITYLNYRSVLDIEGFVVLHGFHAGVNTPRYMYQRFLSSGCVGHTHRLSSYHVSGINGSHGFYEIGCLCSTSPEWTKDPSPNWQQGFLTAEVWNGKLHVNLHHIYPDGFTAYGNFYERMD